MLAVFEPRLGMTISFSMFEDALQQLSLIVPVVLAMLLGGVIGAEREWANKPAGFRTHMLVAGAAALLVGLTDLLVEHFVAGESTIRADPIRVVEAIITGLSFIGAGTIIRRGREQPVEGLTTAASFLLSAAVGIAAALGAYILAFAVSVLTVLILRVVVLLERYMHGRTSSLRDAD